MTHRVGIVGGDGIGPEVIAEGLKVIAAAGVEIDAVNRYTTTSAAAAT